MPASPMKWVPVAKSDKEKPEGPERTENPEKPEKQAEIKNGGKADGKGGKAKTKGEGKGSRKVEGREDRKADWKGEWHAEWQGNWHGEWHSEWQADWHGEWQEESWGKPKARVADLADAGASLRADLGMDAKDGRGKGKAKGKGKGKAKAEEPAPPPPSAGVRTVQEVEADLKASSPKPVVRRPRTGEAFAKQPIDTKGGRCEVHKHSGMGCAVVSLESGTAREEIMHYVEKKCGGPPNPAKIEVGGVVVQLRRHQDKTTHREVLTDIFVAWGHKAEKESPLAVDEIAEAFDKLLSEAQQVAAAAAPPLPVQVPLLRPTGPQGVPPPPPANLPAVGPQGMPAMPLPQAPMHPFYDYQRAAMLNNWMANPALHPFFQPPPQQPASPFPQPTAAWQQAAALVQQQHLQLQQQQLLLQQPPPPQPAPQPQLLPQPQSQPHQAQVQVPPSAPASGSQPAPTPPSVSPEAGQTPAELAPAKPRLLAIVDPQSGAKIDTLGMNFEPRKPKKPLQIINPMSGEAVKI